MCRERQLKLAANILPPKWQQKATQLLWLQLPPAVTLPTPSDTTVLDFRPAPTSYARQAAAGVHRCESVS
jgi:hypothetical protein